MDRVYRMVLEHLSAIRFILPIAVDEYEACYQFAVHAESRGAH